MLSLLLLSLLSAGTTHYSLTVVPLGEVSKQVLDFVGHDLGQRLRFVPTVVAAEPVPESAFSPVRGQYNSSLILDLFAAQRSRRDSGTGCELLVTEASLYMPGQSFVTGQADPVTRTGIVSLAPLREESYGRRRNDRRFLSRTAKVVVHELGHTFGIPHCGSPGCVMYPSSSLADTDRKSAEYCPECRRRMPRTLIRELRR